MEELTYFEPRLDKRKLPRKIISLMQEFKNISLKDYGRAQKNAWLKITKTNHA